MVWIPATKNTFTVRRAAQHRGLCFLRMNLELQSISFIRLTSKNRLRNPTNAVILWKSNSFWMHFPLRSDIHQRFLCRHHQSWLLSIGSLSDSELILRFDRSLKARWVLPSIADSPFTAFIPQAWPFWPFQSLKSKGYRAFAIRTCCLWSDRPDEIRLTKSVTSFKSPLKTQSSGDILPTIVFWVWSRQDLMPSFF